MTRYPKTGAYRGVILLWGLFIAQGCGPESAPPGVQGPSDAHDTRVSQASSDNGLNTSATPTDGLNIGDSAPPDDLQVLAQEDGSFVCLPTGSGPFPGVLYNHGGLGMKVGGDLEGTCRALAESGYVGLSTQRRLTDSPAIVGHLDDVLEGLDSLLALPQVDAERVAVLGFSRGGLLALQAAVERPDLLAAVVLMAPASANGQLTQTLARTDTMTAPVLVLVSENDLFQDDHVALAQEVVDALKERGKTVTQIVYGPFGEDGHERFFTVGDYWQDIVDFISPELN